MAKERQVFSDMLRAAGFRATAGRVKVLSALARAKKPLGAREIQKYTRSKLNLSTMYRMLSALTKAGILYRTDLGATEARFELHEPGEHHHHIVCTDCGRTEDVAVPALERAARELARYAKRFASIQSHTLEFFGTCKICAPR